MELNENDYALWLINVPGIGNASAYRLLETGLCCRDIYEMKEEELSWALSHNQVLKLKRSKAQWDFEREAQELSSKGIRFVSCRSSDFPQKLRDIPDPPFGIYVRGSLPDPDRPAVSIVGARMCSDYGRYMARQFGRDLALAGVQVISGMARGIDGIAQGAALAAGGTSFAVLGCGPDICYPEENIKVYEALLERGGIISEFPPGTKPVANFFPMRNRIISALSDVLLVVEARKKSGTSITVDTALEQGKEVLAVPGRVTDRLSDGCNNLISQGAGIAIRAEDVLDRLWQCAGGKEKPSPDKSSVSPRSDEAAESPAAGEDDEMQEREKSLDEEILDIVDIIPVSMTSIMEELYRRGKEIPIPLLMNRLMDLTGSGSIIQNGAYYRRLAG